MDSARLARIGAALLGAQVESAQNLSGGDLSDIVHLRLDDGRDAIVKSGPAPRVEAAMLRAIGAVGAPVPEVLAVSDEALVLSRIEADDPVSGAWADLGRVLARLHASTGAGYGWHEDYAFGRVSIANHYCDHWPEFWAVRRLLPALPHLPSDLAGRVERLAADLSNRLPVKPPASLLHGDLWSGNLMARGDRIAALIDPACYYGDVEVDLAMLRLFGSPGEDFYQSYGDLPPGSGERLAIYQLWPALVHLRLFGSGYRGLVEAQLRRAGV